MIQNETQNNAYISLHVFSGINLVEAHKQHNVLRNGETITSSKTFLKIQTQLLYFFFFALDAM